MIVSVRFTIGTYFLCDVRGWVKFNTSGIKDKRVCDLLDKERAHSHK